MVELAWMVAPGADNSTNTMLPDMYASVRNMSDMVTKTLDSDLNADDLNTMGAYMAKEANSTDPMT
jgi:hypothetical protein